MSADPASARFTFGLKAPQTDYTAVMRFRAIAAAFFATLFAAATAASTSIGGTDSAAGHEPRLSAEGTSVAFLAFDANQTRQLFLTSFGAQTSRQLTHEREAPVLRFAFGPDSNSVLFERKVLGQRHLFFLDLGTLEVRDLTPPSAAEASLLAVAPNSRDEVLVELTHANTRVSEVWRMAPRRGSLKLDTVTPDNVLTFAVDASFAIRGAAARLPNGGTEIRIRAPGTIAFRPLATVGPHEIIELHGFSADGRSVFMSTSISGDTTRLVEKNVSTGAERVLAEQPNSDVVSVQIHSTRHTAEAAAFWKAGQLTWTVLGWVRNDFEALEKLGVSAFSVLSRDAKDQRWLIAIEKPLQAAHYGLWDRTSQSLTALVLSGTHFEKSSVADQTNASSTPFAGGLLTMPGKPFALPVPVVLWLKGDAFEKPDFGVDPLLEAVVAKGFAVWQVPLPGSRGFGKRFANTGNKHWGGGHSAFVKGLLASLSTLPQVDVTKVALFGTGLAGTSALTAAAALKHAVRCAAVRSAPLNLVSLAAAQQPALNASIASWLLGDLSHADDVIGFTRNSPLFDPRLLETLVLVVAFESDATTTVDDLRALSTLSAGQKAVQTVLYPTQDSTVLSQHSDFTARATEHFAGCFNSSARLESKRQAPNVRPSATSSTPR